MAVQVAHMTMPPTPPSRDIALAHTPTEQSKSAMTTTATTATTPHRLTSESSSSITSGSASTSSPSRRNGNGNAATRRKSSTSKGAHSRRSILANMGGAGAQFEGRQVAVDGQTADPLDAANAADDEPEHITRAPLSKTDSILRSRTRRPSAGSGGSSGNGSGNGSGSGNGNGSGNAPANGADDSLRRASTKRSNRSGSRSGRTKSSAGRPAASSLFVGQAQSESPVAENPAPNGGAEPTLEVVEGDGHGDDKDAAIESSGLVAAPPVAAAAAPSGSGILKLRRRLSNLSIQSKRSLSEDNIATDTTDKPSRGSMRSLKDNPSVSGHRDAISTFISRRTRSRRSSEPPEHAASALNDEDTGDSSKDSRGREASPFAMMLPVGRSKSNNSGGAAASSSSGAFGRRRTNSSASRRLSLKLPGRMGRRGSTPDGDVPPLPTASPGVAAAATSANGNGNGNSAARRRKYAAPEGYPVAHSSDDDEAEERAGAEADAPNGTEAAPDAQASESGGDDAHDEAAAGTREAAVPPTAPAEADAQADDQEASVASPLAQPQQSSSYVGAAAAAIAGAGAALFSRVAPTSATANGNSDGYASESDDEDDVFHDAELADIDEGEEDEEDEQESRQQTQPTTKNAKGLAAVNGSATRTRVLSQTSRDGSVAEPSSPTSPTSPVEQDGARKAPSKLKGTAGARRRAGSTSAAAASTTTDDANATPSDAKARKDVPAEVREKAATVARLTYDDVAQGTDSMRADIEVARGALHLFLNSRMLEAEDIIKEHADRRMYYALGYGLIATMKGFMTFEPEDLATAISYCKDSLHIAHLLRKPTNTVANFGRFVRGTGQSPSALANMTPVQRHAELVYAESLLLKAVLGIVYSGDFFGFVAEALNMRNAYGIYRSLGKYVETADAKAKKPDASIDEDFRSGVFLGNGLISLLLGLLPGKVLKIMDIFGYSGDTQLGLETLERAGGWSHAADAKAAAAAPGVSIDDEGIRRPVCDMGILLFHLVISVFVPVNGVDIPFADHVLHYHLQRYPQGVFFLYFSGRLYSTQAMCERAVVQYAAARDAQQEYVQLQHISWWDASLCHMSLGQWAKARECFDVLLRESNWSKCVYSYGVAANLAQDSPDAAEAADLMAKVPGLMRRIAGKSIPMEKFVARKAHKFNTQGRLLLPALEFSYIYHCMSNAPQYALADTHLVTISDTLASLTSYESAPESYPEGGAAAFWDDLCLAHFLRGVVLRYVAHPEPHSKLDASTRASFEIPTHEAEEQASLSFRAVLSHGHRITTDHYLIYFSHYELGRLLADMGRTDEARKELEAVLSGRMLEDKGVRKGNHKYGMQNMALLRSNGALNALNNPHK